jgi:hypothetical protein
VLLIPFYVRVLVMQVVVVLEMVLLAVVLEREV